MGDDDEDDLRLLQALAVLLQTNDTRLHSDENTLPPGSACCYTGLAWTCRYLSRPGDQVSLAYSTVHRYRRVGFYAIIQALADNISIPSTVPTQFIESFPCFDQALAATDGVHVPIIVAAKDAERFRNRKGWTSTNVIIASDWQLKVVFIYPGVEGSAHDSMVLAHSKLLQQLPQRMYVLADAGYALHSQVLTPHRGVRYHLKEFAEGTGRPRTEKELFNLRHAKSRNVVERLNGCRKRRFRILRVPIERAFVVAKAIIFACACLHNFIRCHATEDMAEDLQGDDSNDSEEEDPARESALPFAFQTPRNWRDWMTDAMWTEYDC
ncbi:unnamed protein product [Phytophthora fragariaefolia]|uniref:Unnamed protein product n=1 Tax=Phytophthora fragariaefolia TaxID=1490495 RepID=A0A9W6Y2B9_9STRA|nr:unnamed protein product [Phytophthora fragariaefolia]